MDEPLQHENGNGKGFPQAATTPPGTPLKGAGSGALERTNSQAGQRVVLRMEVATKLQARIL
jgi:hypothetical protein